MRKPHGVALAALTAALGVVLSVGPVQSQRPPQRLTLPETVAKKTKLDEKDVAKMLDALGPAIRDKLSNGEEVELPGLGTLRVVRIPEHKDLIQGRPGVVPARNTVEFLPEDVLNQAANSPYARPAVTVPVFEYNPLPNQTKSEKVPSTRQPNVRTR